jgi:hypothetical protein
MDIFQQSFKVELAKAMGVVAAQDAVRAQKIPNPVTVTEGVIDAETWAGLITKRGADAQDYWKDRTLHPSKDPIKAGIASEARYVSQTKKALDSGARKKALEKTNLAEWGEDVEATPASSYGDGLKNKSKKIARKIAALQPLVEALRKAIASMPDTTDSEREKKMTAARRGMIVVGQVMKGVLTADALTRAISEVAK